MILCRGQMSSILIVGKNSFIGSNFAKYCGGTIVGYDEIDGVDVSSFDVVINCSIDDRYKAEKYCEEIDTNIKLSDRTRGQFIMLSSRKVYGAYDDLVCHTEMGWTNPTDFYSENKLISEEAVLRNPSSTVLRLSNVYGFEPGRKSFFGYTIDQLLSGHITYTISPDTKRDFIYIVDLCKILAKIAEVKPSGIYNLGSSIATNASTIAENIVNGYGDYIDIYYKTSIPSDQFVLSTDKLKSMIGDIDISSIEETVFDIGRQCKGLNYGK